MLPSALGEGREVSNYARLTIDNGGDPAMAKRESYAPGTPSWVDLATNDPAAAKAFYGGLFGWTFDDLAVGDDMLYSMAILRGASVGAIAPQQAEQVAAGVPPHWQMYITVADVDAAAALVEGAGGSVHVPPFDVMEAGRMAVITDPAGAFFMLWTAINTVGAGVVNEPGAFTWSELVAPPNDRTASFYETVTGLKLLTAPMGDGSSYDGFTLDGTVDTMVAGTIPPQMPGMPAHWSIYFGAADVDASAAKASELGGKVFVEPFDIPVGRMAVIADPQGAMFNLFKMDPVAE
jgi:predicted enzyme related to lactoylglutathione lyase